MWLLFFLLFIVFITILLIGIVDPSKYKNRTTGVIPSRKKIIGITSLLAIIFLILSVATIPPTRPSIQLSATQLTSSKNHSITPAQTKIVRTMPTQISNNTSRLNETKTETNTIPSKKIVSSSVGKPTTGSNQYLLTGYGATESIWNRLHVQDPQKDIGSAYDRQSNGSDKFAGVTWENSRAIEYSIQLFPPVQLINAKQQIQSMLPEDFTIIYDVQKPQCELVQYKSQELESVLGNGYVNVELSNSATPDAFDPTQVDWIIFAPGTLGDQSQIGC